MDFHAQGRVLLAAERLDRAARKYGGAVSLLEREQRLEQHLARVDRAARKLGGSRGLIDRLQRNAKALQLAERSTRRTQGLTKTMARREKLLARLGKLDPDRQADTVRRVGKDLARLDQSLARAHRATRRYGGLDAVLREQRLLSDAVRSADRVTRKAGGFRKLLGEVERVSKARAGIDRLARRFGGVEELLNMRRFVRAEHDAELEHILASVPGQGRWASPESVDSIDVTDDGEVKLVVVTDEEGVLVDAWMVRSPGWPRNLWE